VPNIDLIDFFGQFNYDSDVITGLGNMSIALIEQMMVWEGKRGGRIEK
jgi:hypothetical protein